MCIDLHIHSYYSDGTLSPAGLVKMAADSRLSAIALTDHDTIEGIAEFLVQAEKTNLPVLTGIEISAVHRQHSLHILGYGINHNDLRLKSWLQKIQEGRIQRNEQIISKLQSLGLNISFDELTTLSPCGQTGRPHIAQLLQQKGIVASVDDAFTQYLRKNAAAWVSRFSYSASESIDMIHQAGGLAILAHPGQISPQPAILSNFINELVERGLDGLEVYYPGYSHKVIKKLKKIASRHNLAITGGSDYHGDNKKYTSMADADNGFCPPDSLLGPLYEKINTYQNRK